MFVARDKAYSVFSLRLPSTNDGVEAPFSRQHEVRLIMNLLAPWLTCDRTQRACDASVLALKEEAVRVERAWQAKLAHKVRCSHQIDAER